MLRAVWHCLPAAQGPAVQKEAEVGMMGGGTVGGMAAAVLVEALGEAVGRERQPSGRSGVHSRKF